jgi:hypothetical protein
MEGFVCVLTLAAASVAVAGTKATSTWTAPDLEAGAYTKFLVLARFTDESAKRILEDTMVAKLKKEADALAAYDALAEQDLASVEAVKSKARQLGVDAGIVFTVTGSATQVESKPDVHAGVSIPVPVGPFNIFLGASKPLGGGASTVQKIGVKAELHGLEGKNPRWIGNFTTDLQDGAEGAATDIAAQTIKQLKKAGLFK